MFLSRFALAACLALGVSLLPLAGCNRSSTDDNATATHDETDGGDDAESTASAEKKAEPLEPHGTYFPTVVLKTSLGDLTLKLDPQAAPRTVNNFLHYVESGQYNQTIFHQVDAGYVVLGGTYTAEMVERPGRYPIPNEAKNGRKNLRGTIAMARDIDDIDSSTSQFFINVQDNPHLDYHGESPEEYGFCVFGEVVEGLDVLEKISAVEVADSDDFKKLPVETVLIESAYRVR
jgi:peptidyl-prolyl cis-trans isomerase A (cyclophilin A)